MFSLSQGFAIVYMDEGGFESEALHPFGYAPIENPFIDHYNWQGRKRTNFIDALYSQFKIKFLWLGQIS